MNRSFISVITGGFDIAAGPVDDTDYGEHREIQADATAGLLSGAGLTSFGDSRSRILQSSSTCQEGSSRGCRSAHPTIRRVSST